METKMKNMIIVLCLIGLALGINLAVDSKVSAADSTDYLKAKPEVVEAWKDMRFGMFIHWGPVVLTEKEISWPRRLAEYEKDKPLRWVKRSRSKDNTTDVQR